MLAQPPSVMDSYCLKEENTVLSNGQCSGYLLNLIFFFVISLSISLICSLIPSALPIIQSKFLIIWVEQKLDWN